MIKKPFSYNSLSNYGNYMFYYDYKSGKLRYTFNYSRLPRFGRYVFKYKPQYNITIEENVIFQRFRRSLEDVTIEDSNYNLYKKNKIDININNPVSYLDKFLTTKDILLVDSMNYLVDKNVDIDISIERADTNANKTKIEHDIIIFEEDFSSTIDNRDIYSQELNLEHLKKMNVITNVSTPAILQKSIHNIKESILNDNILTSSIKKMIDIENEIQANTILKNVDFKSDTLFKRCSRELSVDDTTRLNNITKSFQLESDYTNSISIPSTLYITDSPQLDMSSIKEIDVMLDSDTNVTKNSNSVFINNAEVSIKKEYKKGLLEDTDVNTKKDYKNIIIDASSESIRKTHKKVQIESDYSINKTNQNINIESDILLKTESLNIQEEVEEQLKLHKRFWFLDNVGKMDIKILPNADFNYPPKIEIFENIDNIHTFMYKYCNKFSDTDDSSYTIKLYKTSEIGFKEVVRHDLSNIFIDSNIIAENIEINITNKITDDEYYPNSVDFVINIDNLDFDYMIIEQPSGFMGSSFVFVTSEKFFAENHPIPIGEDLGLFEMPISIGIMVDFINILMLVWSKFYVSYSGCVGTKAIQSMVDRVYEWLTLETSLEAESIEAYNRCYRWFRWECEKVYNKAKLDPNLHGNLWIEEIVFEMIDYMEMHHFDSMPIWDNIEKMDEQRNGIFQDQDLDIDIVVTKLKGIRKRIYGKNKRYRDF